MIYLIYRNFDSEEMRFFDSQEDKEDWILNKMLECELEGVDPIEVVSEGSASEWIKQRKPNVTLYKAEITKLQEKRRLEKRKLELEKELAEVAASLSKFQETPKKIMAIAPDLLLSQ